MYLHMLNKEEQELFLSLAILLQISDDEILWDGKTLDELTPATDMKKVSFVISEQEEIVLLGYLKELDKLSLNIDSFDEKSYGAIRLSKNLLNLDMNNNGHTILANFAAALGGYSGFSVSVYKAFIDILAQYPVHKQNDLNTRTEAIKKFFEAHFDDILNEIKQKSTPSVAKIFVYELQIMAMSNEELSDTEKMILDRVSELLDIDTVTKEDLLECAIETTKQVARTLALILE